VSPPKGHRNPAGGLPVRLSPLWSECRRSCGGGQMDAGSGGYAVGWGTLALINAGLADGKNRCGLGWLLVSLLLGPIATLLIVLSPPGRPAEVASSEKPTPGSADGRDQAQLPQKVDDLPQ
jgi:hypothetical protein